jgi:hypothetical protein
VITGLNIQGASGTQKTWSASPGTRSSPSVATTTPTILRIQRSGCSRQANQRRIELRHQRRAGHLFAENVGPIPDIRRRDVPPIVLKRPVKSPSI